MRGPVHLYNILTQNNNLTQNVSCIQNIKLFTLYKELDSDQ